MTKMHLLTRIVAIAVLLSGAAQARAEELALGAKVAGSGSLRDVRGNSRPLQGFKDYRAVVLAFIGTECPVSNLYLPGLVEMEKKLRGEKVLFLAIYPNQHEDLDQIAAHAYDRDLPFPALKDVGHALADSLGVRRVPTVAVLDGDFVLRYRGRIDDRYGVAYRRQEATRSDLGQALQEVLAGGKVSVPETEPDGCLIGSGRETAAREVTFNKQVARILQQRCQACHRPGEAAPFSLLSFDDAVRHARMIKEVTTQRRMPPWHADPRYGKFSNTRRLSAEEIELLSAWVDGGRVRGDDKDAPAPIDWPSGWKFGKPDVVFTMPKEFEVPAEGSLPYQHFTVETGFTEDRWVQTAEARPGAAEVVHHVVVWMLKEGQTRPFAPDGNMSVLVGWAPGDLGLVCPPDTALRVPKGARLLFEMHYTPNGKPAKDRSSIGIIFAKEPPRFELMMNSFANETIQLPPNDPHYRAEGVFRPRADARLISLTPHMHWRGKDYRYEAIYPDGRREVLLSVPRWDFNWQNVYQFQEPIKLPKGARLYSVAHWDNSRNNPYNPDPSKQVRFGLQTWDEMMVGWVAYVWERQETAAELAKTPINQADMLFDRFDRNGDDFITRDEVPEQLRPLLFLSGVAIPERVDRQEFHRLFNEMRQRLGQKEKKTP